MGLFIVEFDLNAESPLTVKNGDVIVDRGYSTVTVRNVEAESHADAENKARPKADAFLSELCYAKDICLEVGDGLTVMQQDSAQTRHIKTMFIKSYIKGSHRKKYPSTLKEVVVKPSHAKSYYRKAVITEDSFDKFRNLYLAIENVASKIAAKCGVECNDFALIKFALQECFSSDEQLKLLEGHSPVHGVRHEGVADCLFKGYRCQLNHSKEGESKKIPFDPNDEREVQSVLPLAEFVAKSLIAYEDNHL